MSEAIPNGIPTVQSVFLRVIVLEEGEIVNDLLVRFMLIRKEPDEVVNRLDRPKDLVKLAVRLID